MPDILLLVCGTKPYELPSYLKLLEQYEWISTPLFFFICSPGASTLLSEDSFSTDKHRVLFMEYQPDFLMGVINGSIFKTIIKTLYNGKIDEQRGGDLMNQYEMKQIAYKSTLKSRALQVLVYLIDRSNKEGTCYPAISTMSQELHISVSTVKGH